MPGFARLGTVASPMTTFQVNGPNLRALRELRHWSLTDLGREAEVSISHLSRAERGERDLSLKTVTRIAEVLGVPIGVLLTVRIEEEVVA